MFPLNTHFAHYVIQYQDDILVLPVEKEEQKLW